MLRLAAGVIPSYMSALVYHPMIQGQALSRKALVEIVFPSPLDLVLHERAPLLSNIAPIWA